MVPHATSDSERRRSPSPYNPNPNANQPKTFKFPDFSHEEFERQQEEAGAIEDISRGPSPQPLPNGLPPGLHSSERWPLRKEASANSWNSSWANGRAGGGSHAGGGGAGGGKHGRQKSLSEAIRTVRGRRASVAENAAEIADSLKAPVSFKLVMLCGVWYAMSILSNTSSKAILTAFPQPITLTIMQFLLVSSWCLGLSHLAKKNMSVRSALPVLKNGIRKPSRDIIMATLPLTAFQIGGHILNSDAMARIPVSLVHTIKGLSPLMTVFAYRFFYSIHYSTPTYLSLIPLTLGVVMACSTSFSGNVVGLAYAFGSAILFVTQNIVSKKLFTDAARAEKDGTPMARRKPDKLNLLCYSSALALLFTLPIWLWSEGLTLISDYASTGTLTLREKPGSLDHGALALEFLFNGTFHFGQSLVAFVLLGMTSPVTYSVASLIKRVAVIIFAIVWFGNPMTRIQGAGFILTFLGLYLYDRTSDAAKADKRARGKQDAAHPLLPVNVVDAAKKTRNESAIYTASPMSAVDHHQAFAGASSYANGEGGGSGPGRPHSRGEKQQQNGGGGGVEYSLPLGTRAEETWQAGDQKVGIGVR